MMKLLLDGSVRMQVVNYEKKLLALKKKKTNCKEFSLF